MDIGLSTFKLGRGSVTPKSARRLISTWSQATGSELTDDFEDNDLTGWTVTGGSVNQNERLEIPMTDPFGSDKIFQSITSRTEYWMYHRLQVASASDWQNNENTQNKDLFGGLGLGVIDDSGTKKWYVTYADDSGDTNAEQSTGPTVGK